MQRAAVRAAGELGRLVGRRAALGLRRGPTAVAAAAARRTGTTLWRCAPDALARARRFSVVAATRAAGAGRGSLEEGLLGVAVVCAACGHRVVAQGGAVRLPNGPFCPECHAILPEPAAADLGVSYFGLFDCEERYAVETAGLARTFRRLQSALHPDKFMLQPQAQQDRSAHWSMQANAAMAVLQDPLKRGHYLLERRGVGISDGEGGSPMAPSLLMDVMELNEALEESSSREETEAVHQQASERVAELDEEVRSAFDRDDLAVAKARLLAMKYYRNIADNAWARR